MSCEPSTGSSATMVIYDNKSPLLSIFTVEKLPPRGFCCRVCVCVMILKFECFLYFERKYVVSGEPPVTWLSASPRETKTVSPADIIYYYIIHIF